MEWGESSTDPLAWQGMLRLLPLLAASLATLALSLSAAGGSERAARPRAGTPPTRLGPRPSSRVAPGAAGRPVPRVDCEHPGALRLRRFEDGSAWLQCAGRVLVRISVPG